MMIHFILPGDTIEKVAKEINLENPVYLKDFHNQHCTYEDRIIDDLQPGKKLFIPSNELINRYNAKNDAPFKSVEQNPILLFNPVEFSESYKVNISEFSQVNASSSKSTLSYFANLKWIETEQNEHLFYFSKDRFSNIHQSKMEFMASEIMKTIYPLHVYTNLKGEILKVVIPNKTIKKFKNDKERLLDLFPDKYAKIYIDEFEYAVLNPDIFNVKMKEDGFLKLFFSSFRVSFKNGKSIFYLGFGDDIVTVNQSANTNSQDNEIYLKQNTSKDDFSYNADYVLSQDNGLIKKINASFYTEEFSVQYTTNYSIELAK